MQYRLTYLSLFFGIASWVLLGLRFTPILGTGPDTLFLFFPPAVLGLITGVVARIRCQDKKLTRIAIWINALPFAILVLFIVALLRWNPRQ
jgi:ABC-type dipeptide/oligopeptide/nickel transport system permease subunit